jgi:hypothetical protein
MDWSGGSVAALFLVTGISVGTTGDTACGRTDRGAFKGAAGLVADDGTGSGADQGSGGGSAVGIGAVVLAAGAKESSGGGK